MYVLHQIDPLAFDVGTFTPGVQKITDFTVENFDVKDLDYSVLWPFKFVKNVGINKCSNAPSKAQPPNNLPTTDLVNLKTISVDGTNIYTPNQRR